MYPAQTRLCAVTWIIWHSWSGHCLRWRILRRSKNKNVRFAASPLLRRATGEPIVLRSATGNPRYLADIHTSSILVLRMAYLSEPPEALDEDGKQQCLHAIREVLSKFLGHLQRYRHGWGSLDEYPPLAIDWLYRSSVAAVFLAHHTHSPTWNKELAELKTALRIVSQRWRSAGEWCSRPQSSSLICPVLGHCLRLLETREAVRVPLI
jgi:hypothetical protein